MKSPVEARSLSSLTNLLANPPHYPRNPTHEVLEPLVLYIVRVPGSKDVFLTPLKPPTKASISAEAVQTSLYYLHVSTEDDAVLSEAINEEKRATEAQSHTATPIARKPLPPAPFVNYPASERPPVPLKSYPYHQPPSLAVGTDNQVVRQAARGQNVNFGLSNGSGNNPIRRKPLGPRAFNSQLKSLDDTSITLKPLTRSPIEDVERSRRWTSSPVKGKSTAITEPAEGRALDHLENLKPGSLVGIIDSDSRSYSAGGTDSSGNPPPPPTRSNLDIQLIRRDPTSDAQWNVGTISHHRDQTDVYPNAFQVQITTPGYQRFARQIDLESFFGADRPNFQTLEERLASASSTSSNPFTRKISLGPPHSALASSTSSNHRRSQDISPNENLGRPLNERVRMGKQDIAFVSPWQGVCVFNTGANGRSLKCHHTTQQSGSTYAGSAVMVAEVRFNLPWAIARSKDAEVHKSAGQNRRAPLPILINRDRKDSWKKNVEKLKAKDWHRRTIESHRNHSEIGHASFSRQDSALEQSCSASESDSDGDDQLDLRLGRERAGGGRKGKNAKLGKLVIYDEGLKMCDLVVAACMAVWWQQYNA